MTYSTFISLLACQCKLNIANVNCADSDHSLRRPICRYGPPLVDIAKTVIARLCNLHYNIAIIVRKLEEWLEGKSSGNEPVSTKKPLFSNRGNLLILANNNIMSFSSLHRNTQGKRTVRTSYIVAYYCNSWSIMAGPYRPTGWAIWTAPWAISEVGHIDWRPWGALGTEAVKRGQDLGHFDKLMDS